MVEESLSMSDTQEWLSSRAGAELLGVKPGKFYYHVERGDIAIKPGTVRKERLYSRADILAVKARLARKKHRPETVLIDWLQSKDIPASLKLAQARYGEEVDLAEAAVYQSWRRNNSLLSVGAFSKDRAECLATVQLVPLPEQVILDILTGRRPETSITPDEVESYERTGGYTLLVTNVVTHPRHPDLLYRALQKVMEFWIAQYPARYITRIYAQAVSEQGDTLIQSFFMAPRPDLAPNAYVLDLARPGRSRMIRKFQAALKEKAPLPDELHTVYAPMPHAQQEHHTPARTPLSSQLVKQSVEKSTLPVGLVGLATFCDVHGLAVTTIRKAIARGELHATRGEWKVGRAIVKDAFNEQEQGKCFEKYPPKKQCSDPACLCHTLS